LHSPYGEKSDGADTASSWALLVMLVVKHPSKSKVLPIFNNVKILNLCIVYHH